MMLIDVNAYLGHYPFRPIRNNTAEEFVSLMDTYNIDMACVSSLEGIYYRDVMKGNYELIEEIAPFKERLIPICNINPMYAESLADFRECVEKLGFKGVKLFPRQHNYDICEEKITKFLNIAAEYGVFVHFPIYIEDLRQRHNLDVKEPLTSKELRTMALLAPKTDIVLSNYNFNSYKDEFKIMEGQRQGGIYFDISRIECLKITVMNEMMEFSDLEHLVFGTGAPLNYIDVQLLKIHYLPQVMKIKEDKVDSIKSANVKKLLKL